MVPTSETPGRAGHVYSQAMGLYLAEGRDDHTESYHIFRLVLYNVSRSRDFYTWDQVADPHRDAVGFRRGLLGHGPHQAAPEYPIPGL